MGSTAARRSTTSHTGAPSSSPHNKTVKLEKMDKPISETLPALPAALKNVSPYVQRAEELRTKDPIMAYWCAWPCCYCSSLDEKMNTCGRFPWM